MREREREIKCFYTKANREESRSQRLISIYTSVKEKACVCVCVCVCVLACERERERERMIDIKIGRERERCVL